MAYSLNHYTSKASTIFSPAIHKIGGSSVDNDVSEMMQDQERLEAAYHAERPRLVARMRKAGRSLEEAEDLVHDVFVETLSRLSRLGGVINLGAWLNQLFTRRMIDLWRHEQVRRKAGETDVAEETLQEIIAGAGLDPLDSFVRDSLVDTLNDALQALPKEQRVVLEAQVFGGRTLREIAEGSQESIDTIAARKRYAIQKLGQALRHWIED